MCAYKKISVNHDLSKNIFAYENIVIGFRPRNMEAAFYNLAISQKRFKLGRCSYKTDGRIDGRSGRGRA